MMTEKEKKEEKLATEEVAEEAATESKVEEAAQEPEAPKTAGDLLNEELRRLQEENAKLKSDYQLLLAEKENARKRLQKENREFIKYAIRDTVREFLDPLDNLENALGYADNMSDEVKNWAVGFKMIATQFQDALGDRGIVAFHATEGDFDPEQHEAVEIVEIEEGKDGQILSQFAKGYKMDGTIVRPAKVKVARLKQADKEVQKEQLQEEAQGDKDHE